METTPTLPKAMTEDPAPTTLPGWVQSFVKHYGPVGVLAVFAVWWGNNIDGERKAQSERAYLDSKASQVELLANTKEQTKATTSVAVAISQSAENMKDQTKAIEAQGKLLEAQGRALDEVSKAIRDKP